MVKEVVGQRLKIRPQFWDIVVIPTNHFPTNTTITLYDFPTIDVVRAHTLLVSQPDVCLENYRAHTQRYVERSGWKTYNMCTFKIKHQWYIMEYTVTLCYDVGPEPISIQITKVLYCICICLCCSIPLSSLCYVGFMSLCTSVLASSVPTL